MNSGVKRIFLGIPLDNDLREKVSKLQEELKRIAGGFNLVNPKNLHLTLKFLGEISEDKLEKVKSVLESIDWGKRFEVKVSGMGAFPNTDYVRVVWLGLEGEELFYLQKKVEEKLGEMFPEEREFSAHVTLSRVKFVNEKEKLKQFLLKKIDLGKIRVNKVVLYESELGKKGPEYEVLEEYGLS